LEDVALNEPVQDFGREAQAIAELTELIVGQIRRLSDLHREGILTEEEFTAKKSELLARL